MTIQLNESDVVTWLREQTDKTFVQVFYKAAAGRRLAPVVDAESRSHLVIVHATRNSDAYADWEMEFIGIPANSDEWAAEAVIAQRGEHCAQTVLSFARDFPCPLCGQSVHAT